MTDFRYLTDNTTLPRNETLSSSSNGGESCIWVVNIVVMLIVLLAICCFYYYHAKDMAFQPFVFGDHSVSPSSHHQLTPYQESVLRREKEKELRFIEDPDQRKIRIRRYFARNSCRMIVHASDIIENNDVEVIEKNVENSTDEEVSCYIDSTEKQKTSSEAKGKINSEQYLVDGGLSNVTDIGTNGYSAEIRTDQVIAHDIESHGKSYDDIKSVPAMNASNIDTENDSEYGYLVLRGNRSLGPILQKNDYNGHQTDADENKRGVCDRTRNCVPNCCSICLDSYAPDDVVVWSPSSSDCQHAFHEDCILDWMCTNQKGTPCPICRQNILPNLHQYYNGKYIKKYNLEPPQSTFSLSAIRW